MGTASMGNDGEQSGAPQTVTGATVPDLIREFFGWWRKRPILGGAVLLFVVTPALLLLAWWKIDPLREKIDRLFPENQVVDTDTESSKEKVILLLPTGSDTPESIKDDAERQVLGFFDYLSSHDPQDELALEVVVRSHGWEGSQAERIVEEEMRKGNRFYVVTMSKIAGRLAENWAQLSKDNCKSKKCYLIATVASAPNIPKGKKNVYRFYVRSDEEAKELARIALRKFNVNNVVAICAEDQYGRGAESKFREIWEFAGRRVSKTVFLTAGASERSLDDKFDEILRLPAEEREAVFIANYGGGIGTTIRELHERDLHPILLTTSTFSIPEWRAPVAAVLDKFSWISLRPAYRGDVAYRDVVRDFTYFSLMRTQHAIEKSSNGGISFDQAWRQVEFPYDLSFRIDESGDSEVKVDIFE